VCITVAYRLGVFGFLDFAPLLGREYEGTANNGLSDLVMALAWIQDNIAAFGGDPGKVTIGGESAGAKLTDILMGVPAARPLFQQMISESGGAERIWQHGGAVGIAKGFEQAWKEDSGATTDDALKTADGAALIKTQEKLLSTWPLHYPLRAEVDGRLVPQLPIQRIAGGSTRGKRLLIGTNREESALFIGAHPSEVAAINLGNIDLAKFNEVFVRYKELYSKLTPEQLRIRAVTAEEYWVPSMRVAEAHVHGGGTAYVYELEFVETSGRLADNAYHSLDVGMVWGHPHMQVADAEAEAALGKQMHAAWVAFIRGDAPGAPGLPAWPDYTAETHATMILGADGGATSRVEQGPQAAELALWGGVL
jgi:para-nitrobenzyl esterase